MTPDNDATKLPEHIHHYPGTGRYEIVPEDGEPWSVWIDPRYVASDDLRAIAAHMDAQAGRPEAVGVTEADVRDLLSAAIGFHWLATDLHPDLKTTETGADLTRVIGQIAAALAQPTAMATLPQDVARALRSMRVTLRSDLSEPLSLADRITLGDAKEAHETIGELCETIDHILGGYAKPEPTGAIRGKYQGVLGSVDEFLAEKHGEPTGADAVEVVARAIYNARFTGPWGYPWGVHESLAMQQARDVLAALRAIGWGMSTKSVSSTSGEAGT